MKKKLVMLTLCGMMAASALTGGMAMQTFAAEAEEPMVIAANEDNQIPNPWKDYDSVADAADAAGFSVKLPKTISGYQKDAIQAIDGSTVQVFYKNGEKEILIRKGIIGEGRTDISGDYNTYGVTKKVAVKGKKTKVTVKGTEGKKYLAIWHDGTYAYSISTSAGMSQKALIKLVKQVQ